MYNLYVGGIHFIWSMAYAIRSILVRNMYCIGIWFPAFQSGLARMENEQLN